MKKVRKMEEGREREKEREKKGQIKGDVRPRKDGQKDLACCQNRSIDSR